MRPFILIFPMLALACNKPTGFVWPESTGEVVATYAAIAEASYADSQSAAAALHEALLALVSQPSAERLTQAQQAWRDSREPYLQTEVFRFYDGPIDNPEDGPEATLNAWPLDEAWIDYVEGDPDAGLINGEGEISAEVLLARNEQGGEKNISLGYHAIEFLLWGQDFSADGPGQRPYTDYLTDGSGSNNNQDRRGLYLAEAGAVLVEQLAQVQGAWSPDAAYRQDFEADPEGSFARMLTGLIVLSGFETGGERLQASLDSGDQEDEHSCFSDNTHRDMIGDVAGMINVWTGRYTRLDGAVVQGASLRDAVAEVAPELAADLDAQLAQSLSLAQAIEPPYDQEIAAGSEGRERVQALVISLLDQEDLLFEVFDTFGLTVEIPQ